MNTIPLHQLPDEAYILVLQSMEIRDQLEYSACSKNTKRFIKSLNLTAEEINLCVSRCLEFEFEVSGSVLKLILSRPGTAAEWKMEAQNFRVQYWLDHFCEILHHPRINKLSFNGEHINEDFIKPVQKVVEGFHIVSFSLGEDLTPEFTKKALESFSNYEELKFHEIPFDSAEVYKMGTILIQNLRQVFIREADDLKIDQVLLANCEKLKLHTAQCSLIKNSRYSFSLPGQHNRPFDEEVFFKGIKRTKIPLDCQEVYRDQVDRIFYNETRLAGGSRIRRYDGTTAVVLIERSKFEFIVDV
ncbi:unnamed protein product [Caenorhabditis brenneri]